MGSEDNDGAVKSIFNVAIDFGTAYSGYVFAVQSHMEQIHSVHWGLEQGLKTVKTPTCILFNEERQFSRFGYEAVMEYHSLPSCDAQKWFYFNNFKMELYNKKLTPEITLTASNGKTMPALTVFSESMRFMMNHALATIAEASSVTFSAADVTWVLTVPAIWDSGAKQFMRLAAKEAGLIKDIQSEKLVIALEPEAASIWCKQLPREGFVAEGGKRHLFINSPGLQYIVVDCGGGTIDMTVHEIQKDKSLKELHKATGGGWGGTMVDENFLKFLKELFHSGVWEEYTAEHPGEMQQLMYGFGLQKCSNRKGNVVIRCYYNLVKVAEKRQEMAEYFVNKEGVSWSDGCIVITEEKMKSFYTQCLTNIVGALRNMLTDTGAEQLKYILLVGGFAASIILRDAISKAFSNICILCPLESQAAVVKGALLFANNPQIITQRICARTYGVRVWDSFQSEIHSIKKKRITRDRNYVFCSDIFRKLVGIGEAVDLEKEATYIFYPAEHDQSTMCLKFYATEREEANYIDDIGVEKIGFIHVSMPNQELGRARPVRLQVKFGQTEIKITATDLCSNETGSVMLDFLTR